MTNQDWTIHLLEKHGDLNSSKDVAKLKAKCLVGPIKSDNLGDLGDLREWVQRCVHYLSLEQTALIILNGDVYREGFTEENQIKSFKHLLTKKILDAHHKKAKSQYGSPEYQRVASAIFAHLPQFRVYDPEWNNLAGRELSEACSAIKIVAENTSGTPQVLEALVKLFLYLWIWHGEIPNYSRMKRAVDELAASDVPLVADVMDFGPTTNTSSDLWDDKCTCEYWDGDKYATPHGAAKAGALVHSQAQGAGMFGRDAMDDAIAVGKLFGGRVAVSASL